MSPDAAITFAFVYVYFISIFWIFLKDKAMALVQKCDSSSTSVLKDLTKSFNLSLNVALRIGSLLVQVTVIEQGAGAKRELFSPCTAYAVFRSRFSLVHTYCQNLLSFLFLAATKKPTSSHSPLVSRAYFSKRGPVAISLYYCIAFNGWIKAWNLNSGRF